ncbi:GNAT family N-acetyltransferase [Pararhodobacter sp. SW119]|uniref:GNAT family N-acetyltransferase n=1 Tax=Pararhodobacter sp. SW119 TaxID=2780075 RepID=UPI001ADF82CA|nr:GNAT family N-acetyltransferase [Pararhodobacter sp. SW119]
MSAPHLTPIPGPAADFAARLRAELPVLETGRCILRAPVLEDAPAWEAIMVPDAEGHLGGPHDAESAFREFAATVGTWLLRGHGLWTVTDRAGAVLGFVLIGFEPGDPEPELGFLFCEEARGQGYAAEAAAAARRHALETLRLPALVSCIAPGNAPSRRLAERLGARLDGVLSYPGDAEPAEIWRHAPGEAA